MAHGTVFCTFDFDLIFDFFTGRTIVSAFMSDFVRFDSICAGAHCVFFHYRTVL